ENPLDILMKVTSEPPIRPDRIEPLLPPPLTRLIMRLLAKNPLERPQSAEEVRRELYQLRRDLEEGRVFVFDDAPRMSQRSLPMPAPWTAPRSPWRSWAYASGAAMLFLCVCLVARGTRSKQALPLPELPLVDAPATEVSHAAEAPTIAVPS